jgi:acyl carrier protein
MQVDKVREQIKRFIVQQFPLARQRDLDHDDPLLESGILDSLGVLDVVTFLEDELGLTIADDELLPENFHSITSVAAFVERKRNATSLL